MAPKPQRNNQATEAPAKAIEDPRFSRLHTDPRFVRPKKHSQKVVLDERFRGALEDGKGEGSSGKVDRFGRKVGKSAAQEELRRFYRLEGDEGKGKGKGAADKPFIDFARGQVLLESSDEDDSDEGELDVSAGEADEDEDSSSDDGEVELGPSRGGKRQKRAASEFSVDLDEDAPVASTSVLLGDDDDENAPIVEPTTRIAIVNMDWDNLFPADIFKVFSSLLSSTAPPYSALPPKRDYLVDEEGNLIKQLGAGKDVHRVAKGRVEKVTIYKSMFGKERMAREDKEGPPREIFRGGVASNGDVESDPAEEDEEDPDKDETSDIFSEDEGADYDEEALRKYQLERLRYFFAVVQLDSTDAARHVYEEVQGTEFETTANIFDLSYVPNDLELKDEYIHDECHEEAVNYKGVEFVTDALRHSKVKLTWDAEDPHRAKFTRLNTQKLSRDELDKLDFGAYIASGSESDDAENAAPVVAKEVPKDGMLSKRERMRKLMGLDGGGLGEDEDAGGMEITFAPALSGKLDDKPGPGEETSLDVYKRKEKERREGKKKERKGVVDGDGDGEAEAADVETGFDDEFFNDDVDLDGAINGLDRPDAPGEDDEAPAKGRKKTREERRAEKADKDRRRAELEEALGSDDSDDAEGGGRHFNMNDIIKAEKIKGKRRKGAKAKRLAEIQDDFAINATDERFKSVFEEPEYAIDPSNPHFKKTKNMETLLEQAQKERRKKREQQDEDAARRKAALVNGDAAATKDTGLSSLVASIKRRAQDDGLGAKGKRRRA